ncbi:hypothetical protein FIM08_02465 [SAR202 cluster bacterium AC-647-N09_OGT_505m]|nr:hypothetical protein [SAR202 cluster bacterium AC-647-N09_OGT_505m]
MEFIVRTPRNNPDEVEVRYDCACGCKPRARYQRGTDEANHEHCCCGQVHFVGARAKEQLEAYLKDRSMQGLDQDLGGYSTNVQQVETPWGEPVPVAYGVPAKPRAH